MPSHGVCYVPYGGLEHGKSLYQVLVHSANAADFVWSEASNGQIPTGAIQGVLSFSQNHSVKSYNLFFYWIKGGVGGDGERMFIGRVRHQGTMCIGKVHPSHSTCYIAFGGHEHAYRSYEVLCVKHIPLEH